MKRAAAALPLSELKLSLKNRFSEFNRNTPPSKGRKYPAELRALIQKGVAAGIRPSEIRRLTGMSETAISYARSKAKPEKARRLEVVGPSIAPKGISPLLVRLPSGIIIEFADSTLLSSILKAAQNSLEVSDAASR